MWFLKKSLLGLALVVGAAFPSFAAEMGSNLFFEGIDPSLQQKYWDYLMRYKIWGTEGISISSNVKFPDELGWTGTATGSLTAGVELELGGPIILGGGLSVGNQADLTTGPVRSENGFTAQNANGHNYFKGQYCIVGTVNDLAREGIQRGNGNLRTGDDASTGDCAEAKVPFTKRDLVIPDTVENLFSNANPNYKNETITIANNGGTAYLDVPPGEGMIDLYYDGITFGTDGKLFVRMPPGGRLTRIFLKNFTPNLRITIQVMYVGPDYVWNSGSKTYSSPGAYKLVSNDDYTGNLMFYFPNSITFDQNAKDMYPLQGTFISKQTIELKNQATLAGQLLATNIVIGANFDGSSFHFMPFDPPIIDFLAAANFPIDEPNTLYATEMVYLSDGNQSEGAIKLDRVSENEISFKYCYKFEGADDNSDAAVSLKAGKADVSWNDHSSDMPLCSADTSTHPKVVIKAGDLYPSSPIKVWVYRDGLAENTEMFTMYVYNIKGSIFKNSQDSRNVGLFINDKDAVTGNSAPVAEGYTAEVSESAAPGPVCGISNSTKVSTCKVIATDKDGDVLTYAIIDNNIDDVFSINSSTGEISLVGSLDFETIEEYPLMVSVSDGHGGSATVIVTVKVVNENEDPTVSPLVATVNENAPINTYVGTITASDPETPYSMLSWRITSGNTDGGTLTEPFMISGGSIYVKQYPLDYEKKNQYVLGIEVCDDGKPGTTKRCVNTTATINIGPLNEPPIVTHDTCYIKENTAAFLDKSGKSKTCRVTGTDPENAGVTYSLTSDLFQVGTDGKITLKSGKTPDYETAQEHYLEVTIKDKSSDHLSSKALALIKVLNVDESPSAKPCEATISENSEIGTPTCWIEAWDPEDKDDLIYEITDGEGKDLFSINDEGYIKVAGLVDYDVMSPKYYELTITVSDQTGNPVTTTAKITVTDINEPPSYTDVACSVEENTTVFVEGANCKIVSTDQEKLGLTFNIENGNILDGSDPIFAIDASTGVITVNKAPDYEMFTGTTLYISIKDKDESGNFVNTVYAKATITVINVNEKPTLTVKNGTIAENSPVGTDVDCGTNEHGQAFYCIVPQDEDAGTELTYSIEKIEKSDPKDEDPIEGTFEIVGTNKGADIRVNKDVIDYEKIKKYVLTVRVCDNGVLGTGTDALCVDETLEISVIDGNEKPTIKGFDPVTIDENSPPDVTVIGTVDGDDVDGDDVTYSIVAGNLKINGNPSFAIDENGKITVATLIDYESLPADKNPYKLTVRATDPNGLYAETIVTVTIRDINEGPEIDDATMTVAENQPKGTTVGTLELYDQDKKDEFRQNTFEAIGGDKDLFTIDSKTGEIKTNAVFDYEAKTSYSLVVRVYDQDGHEDTATVKINIADIKESSEIVVTYAETGSGAENWTNPVGTLYTNENSMLLQWTADGKPMPDTLLTNLHEGYNVVTLTYTDPTKNKGVTETVGIFVSTRTPEVTVTTSANPAAGANIFTLVETVDESDTSVYVNKKNNDIVITIKEPVIDKSYTDSTCNYETHSFTVNTELEPVNIPSTTYDVVNKIAAAGPVLNENPASDVAYSQYNNDQVKVSYTEKIAGVDVEVSYVMDKDGNVMKQAVMGPNGKIDSIEVITVSYQVTVDGKVVNVSYVADAITGQALKTTTVNNSGTDPNGGKGTGNSAPVYMYSLTEGEVLYSVTYDFKTNAKGIGETTVQVTYTVNQKGVVTKDKDGNVGYAVSYTYVNEMGNASTQSVYIVVDLIPPKVIIKSPENESVLHSNMVKVEWYVDLGDGRGPVLQDSLEYEGLQPGEVNEIVRFYRDKAGNEASDVVYVMAKNTKDVDISVEKPVSIITKEDVEKYYATKEPEPGQSFSISIYNPQSEKEVETMIGGKFKNRTVAHDSVYPGLPGHLGPTLGILTKVPVINAVDGLATLDDLVGSDGMVLLDAVDAVGSNKVTVEEFVRDHCDADFRAELGSDISKANIYDTKMNAKIWVYTSLGQFVDYFSFSQELNDPSYASDAGVLTMYFEMKPDKNGDVHTANGRLYATGAYVYKTEITMKSKLRCDLPPFDDVTNANKMGLTKKVKEDLLKSFGYKRPKSKKK